MKRILSVIVVLFASMLAACDSNPAPVGPTATLSSVTNREPPATEQPPDVHTLVTAVITPVMSEDTPAAASTTVPQQRTGTVVDMVTVVPPATTGENISSPTPVTATSTGVDMTALQALASLKARALKWQADARIAIVANVRPREQKNILTGTMGDPDVYEPTPGGMGRNWTLVAFSPLTSGAYAFSMDGTEVDLVKEGVTTDVMQQRFGAVDALALSLAKLETSRMVDSDGILQKAGEQGKSQKVGVALFAPEGLGVGPLPTPQSGGKPPQLAYEMFLIDSVRQSFIFFDALSGAVVLDRSAP